VGYEAIVEFAFGFESKVATLFLLLVVSAIFNQLLLE
jgi:hypothetical protein